MRVITCLMLAFGVACVVRAEEKPDAAARAETVAPFIDETTIVIVHADMTRFDPRPFVAVVLEMLPEFKNNSPELQNRGIETIGGYLSALARAGCKDLYVVMNLRVPDWPALVVPLPEVMDQERLKAIIEEAEGIGPREMHGALVVADYQTLDRFAESSPVPRSKLAPAFEAVGDAAAQVLILPPEHTARVLEAVLPTLPDELGGGPSSVFTNIQWTALGINMKPRVSLQVTTQMRDEQGAVALRGKWRQIVDFLGQDEGFREVVSNYDQIAPLMIPKAEGARLVLEQAEGSPGAVALEEALESVFAWARSRIEQREGEGNGSE